MNMTAIGFDIAKGVVQAPGVDACGQVVVRKRLSGAAALAFFGVLSLAWSDWRPAEGRIWGLARRAVSVTRRA